MNVKLIKACECVSAQKRGLLLKSHLISKSQMEKSKNKCSVRLCVATIKECLFAQMLFACVCKERRRARVCHISWNPNAYILQMTMQIKVLGGKAVCQTIVERVTSVEHIFVRFYYLGLFLFNFLFKYQRRWNFHVALAQHIKLCSNLYKYWISVTMLKR